MDKNVKQDLLGLMYMLTEDADKQIIISTAAGTYVGNFIPKEKNEKYHTVYAISDKLHQISDTEQTSSDSDVIVLVDVTLISSSHQEFKMPFVYLFTDQIIGVSLGKYSIGQ
ncbi:TPA: hypothetical protein ACHWZD_001262 [Streptococcus agalactiae]|jgi:hypothetical protein|uniref:Uncharacterized protein n=5 Tax=Streptococcus agalactiae TaxID=1311 RepID=A0A0H1U7L6_STRAG|nr:MULTISPECIES: hypothetical protein [Streptococcus]AYJ74894.1 hypothetical protein [Streptococcus phage LF1]AYJ75077.1 hypothetical protein [Streptococcus phage LF4]QBX17679.1 hypothetical protein Javan37_0048 [Streptococcus phage Javan37]QBX22342.1 hypothetical protein Javan7_0007 [Streptococcus phage Javan7]HDL8977823.1 hypothetical protein [Staphylococcus aureus]